VNRILSILLLCLSAEAATFTRFVVGDRMSPGDLITAVRAEELNFNTGSFLVAPHSNVTETNSSQLLYQSTNGVVLHGTSNFNTGSVYGMIGTNTVANSSFEAVITLLALETNGVFEAASDFPGGGSWHGGIGLRYRRAGNNFALMAMLGEKSDDLQIVDRSNGVEIVRLYPIPQGIDLLKPYRLRVENTNGASGNVYLWDHTTGVLITNILHTINGGVPADGHPTIHVYGVSAAFREMRWTDASGNVLADSDDWADVSDFMHTNPPTLSGGVLTVPSAGFAWRSLLSNKAISDAVITGELMRISSRLGGIIARANTNASQSYFAAYDHTNQLCRIWAGPPESPTVLNSSEPVNLTAGQWYPFSFSLTGSNLSWTVNGATVTASNALYTAGFVGTVNLSGSSNSAFAFRNLKINPL